MIYICVVILVSVPSLHEISDPNGLETVSQPVGITRKLAIHVAR